MSDRENAQQSTQIVPFNPHEHLMKIKSRNGEHDYLPVQWRIVWFRSICPNGSIETEVVLLEPDRDTEEEGFQWNNETRRSDKIIKRAPGFAVFRATVKDGKGGIATGTKSEKAASFPDYVEKAETGSIGRALAALGYGTQFVGDEFDEAHRIVDAPVERGASIASVENGTEKRSDTPVENRRPAAGHSHNPNSQEKATQKTSDEIDPNSPVTDQQLSSIKKLCQHLGKPEPDTTKDPLNYQAAKELIAQLSQEYRQSRSKAS